MLSGYAQRREKVNEEVTGLMRRGRVRGDQCHVTRNAGVYELNRFPLKAPTFEATPRLCCEARKNDRKIDPADGTGKGAGVRRELYCGHR